MAYYLGRDCDVYFTTEGTSTADMAIGVNASNQAYVDSDAAITAGNTFALSMASAASVSGGRVSDLIGVDLSLTASDEDVGPFFGHINTQKVTSGRKDTTITVTRKKKDNVWDIIFNGPSLPADFEGSTNEAGRMGARFGLADGATTSASDIGMGLDFPAYVCSGTAGTHPVYGYRVHMRLRNGDGTNYGEVITLTNCAITGHSVSVNADGTTEETMELTTSVMPAMAYSTTAATFNTTETALGMF
tara:strand:- start:533 stop:1270 length:738 start_codon:yes stop_codon:yes gene_type:complete